METGSSSLAWYVLHVKSRHEKIVAALLEQKGIESFVPLRAVQRKWSDRSKIVKLPIFSGYVFVYIDLATKREALITHGVVSIIGKTSPKSVPVEQIDSIKRFIESEVDIDPYPNFVKGKMVEVIRGPFKGVQGVLKQKKGKYRLLISIELINQSAGIEIDMSDVRLLDPDENH